MSGVNDWAAKAASHILSSGCVIDVGTHKDRPTEARIVAIIATFAEPLVALLKEARRSHSRGYQCEEQDYPPCPASEEDDPDDAICTCSAEKWNARIEAALAGEKPASP